MEFLARFAAKDNDSKNIAKERLRMVLVHDRTQVAPHIMEAIREDIVKVISRYMDVDESNMEVDLINAANMVAVTASIPVKTVKRGRGGE